MLAVLRWSAPLLVAASLLVAPSLASAQGSAAPELSEADRAEARALFAAGTAAVDAGRWADAVQSYERAYALTRAPSALFNVAFALRALGRYRDALQNFDALLALENTSDAMRAQATELREEVRGRIATLRLDGLDPEGHYTIRLDGEPVTDGGARPVTLQADPGRHSVDVAEEGFLPFTWSGSLGPGEVRALAIALEPAPVVPQVASSLPTQPPVTPPSSSLVEEPWLWIVIGVVVAGGAAFAGFYADDQAQLRPEAPASMTIRL